MILTFQAFQLEQAILLLEQSSVNTVMFISIDWEEPQEILMTSDLIQVGLQRSSVTALSTANQNTMVY